MIGTASQTKDQTGPAIGWDGQPLRIPGHVPGALWRPNFPTAEQVDAAAAFLPSVLGRAALGTGVDQAERNPERDPEAELAAALHGVDLFEGPSWNITISPGKVKVWTRDESARDRTENRQRDAETALADAMATFLGEDGEVPERKKGERGSITEWSRKSQNRMREAFLDLDYAPWMSKPERVLSMGTVTYPRCWVTVAPDSETVMKHLDKLRKRYERAFGEPFYAIWKKEFQARRPHAWCSCDVCAELDDGRAPHVHFLFQPPTRYADGSPCNFKQWLSENWTEVVDHPDPEQRELHRRAGTNVDTKEGLACTDPRRTADYFAKHSGGAHGKKAYQHQVPKAWGARPGRFWGYWALEKKTASVRVTQDTGRDAGRIVRRYSKAQQVTRRVLRPRVPNGRVISKYAEVIGLAGVYLVESRPEPKYRGTRIRAVRAQNNRGWLSLNSGPDFACDLGFALRKMADQRQADQVRAELERCGLWDTPLGRARRLAPSPRRDALVARLEARERASQPVEWLRYPAATSPDAACFTNQSWTSTRPTCSRCGDRLAAELAHIGHHIGDCLDRSNSWFPKSPRACRLEEQDMPISPADR